MKFLVYLDRVSSSAHTFCNNGYHSRRLTTSPGGKLDTNGSLTWNLTVLFNLVPNDPYSAWNWGNGGF